MSYNSAKPALESPLVMPIANLSNAVVGRSVRLAGRVLMYEEETQVLLLASNTHAIWIDISVCVDPTISQPFLRDFASIIVVFAHIKQSEAEVPLYNHDSRNLRPVQVHRHLFAEAFGVRPEKDLDLDAWEETALRLGAMLAERKSKAAEE
ncbi:hypothetical protein DL93DRAFT_2168740 [Clavulina sp. PMI_390]|nr:hypothetical protein DL93DRAFT_2168740 [Clavulina sp. PMI_390]